MDLRVFIPERVLWISYAAWGVMELWVMSRDARRFSGRTADRGSFFGFFLCIPLALGIAFSAPERAPMARIEALQPVLSWVGIGMVWAGMAFRLWAIQTLGAFFRTTVVVQDEHRLVTAGPYRWLRHPAYTGTIVSMAGLGLALGNWVSVLAMAVLPAIAIGFRMRVEEQALTERFGPAYQDFRRVRSAVIPLVW